MRAPLDTFEESGEFLEGLAIDHGGSEILDVLPGGDVSGRVLLGDIFRDGVQPTFIDRRKLGEGDLRAAPAGQTEAGH